MLTPTSLVANLLILTATTVTSYSGSASHIRDNASLKENAGKASDLKAIVNSFRVRYDRIIEPKSVDNGAQYLNESILQSNRNCILWCWETTNCNVAVFGSPSADHGRKCYLFDCGPHTKFCLYVSNSNYIASSLRDDREKIPLSSRHDHKNKVTTCSERQFRCANNSACIAIQKHCDGIFDCHDHSDEQSCPFKPAPELTYPTPDPDQEKDENSDVRVSSGDRYFAAAAPAATLKNSYRKQSETGQLSVPSPTPNVMRDDSTLRHDSPRMSITLTQVEGSKAVSPADVRSGAILAMALGLCVTALLLVLVGCKLRLVKRRLVDWRSDNRKGLSLLADDDDDYEEEEEEANQGMI